ncbi:hypothetical protein ACSBR1_004116 [Camellia fascicularis]
MCDNLVEILGDLKLEPIENVGMEIINNLGFSTLGSIGVLNVMLSSWDWEKERKLSMQGCHDKHIFYAYLPGSNVPA